MKTLKPTKSKKKTTWSVKKKKKGKDPESSGRSETNF